MLALLLSISATQVPPTAPPAQAPAAAPAPLHYRIETQTASETDQTSVGRGKMSGTLATTAFVTVTLADSADGQLVRVTVDSVKLVPTGAMTQSLPLAAVGPISDSVRGAYVRAFAARGAIRGAPQASSASPALASVLQAMNVLFPGLRSALKVGDTWADTSNVNSDVPSSGGKAHQSGRIIATWKVTGQENGGLVLDGTSVTNTVTTATNGQTLRISGTSQEHMVLAGRGPVRSASIESSRDITTTLPNNPTPIPAKSTASLKVIAVP